MDKELIEKVAEKIAWHVDTEYTWKTMPDFPKEQYGRVAQDVLSFTISRGGEVCSECKGSGEFPPAHNITMLCPSCKGTGSLPIETKEVKEIIKEWEND